MLNVIGPVVTMPSLRALALALALAAVAVAPADLCLSKRGADEDDGAVGQQLLREGKQMNNDSDLVLDYETAVQLASLPMKCYNQEYPHKFSHTYNSSADLVSPLALHPIFYGCFDWHSSAHGHWLLAAVANRFPDTVLEQQVADIFDEQFTAAKVATELALFNDGSNKDFERTYGWAWALKLYDEVKKSRLDGEKGWSTTLKPLADRMVEGYMGFLPSLVYPIRVGEHPNLAFGLVFALEHADSENNAGLAQLIRLNATSHYAEDESCPLKWEPSGFDFLSPCLQEADLMARVVANPNEYVEWLREFLPQLFDADFHLEPGHVLDRTDGKLVHLDGLNFSRAWNFYSLITRLTAQEDDVRERLLALGDEHIRTSMDYVVDSHYSGSHWLASFLLHALEKREVALQSMARDFNM